MKKKKGGDEPSVEEDEDAVMARKTKGHGHPLLFPSFLFCSIRALNFNFLIAIGLVPVYGISIARNLRELNIPKASPTDA